MRAKRFEDLIAWQKGRELSKAIYALTRLPAFQHDLQLIRQMRGAARSTMANVAEGFERRSRDEFHQHVVVAKGSCGEVRSDLYLALDNGYIELEVFQKHLAQSEELSRILEGLRAELDRQRRSK